MQSGIFIEILRSVFFVEMAYESSVCEDVANLFDSNLWADVRNSDNVFGVR